MGDEVVRKETCRILVIGSHRARLDKVLSLLPVANDPDPNLRLRIEYLPCIAKFASYQDEAGTRVRYLASIEYYPRGSDGALSSSPASLLPFFDEEDDGKKDCPRFLGIAGAAIGSGIEGQEDTARIDVFLKTMVSANKDKEARAPKLKTIEPNPGCESMQDELAAYKELTVEEKDEATRLQTMGPAKMAKFVSDFTAELIHETLRDDRSVDESSKQQLMLGPASDLQQHDVQANAETEAPVTTAPRPIDPDKDRFSCRKCRTILFGVADLQDPAHEPSQHRFSYRKMHHGACSSSSDQNCQSYFLQDSLDWMGDDIRNGCPEGKFSCPLCDSKLGNWIWSGTQCSCGTWVVPAIQIPKSKVDVVMTPRGPSALPPGTVASPLLQQQLLTTSASV